MRLVARTRNEVPGPVLRAKLKVRRFLRKVRVLTEPHDAGRNLKLNLGCGSRHLDGYVNIDIDERNEPDLLVDFLGLGEHFAPGSVSEILMTHTIAYIRLWEARDLFSLAMSLLRP